jgi:hypothetical protein
MGSQVAVYAGLHSYCGSACGLHSTSLLLENQRLRHPESQGFCCVSGTTPRPGTVPPSPHPPRGSSRNHPTASGRLEADGNACHRLLNVVLWRAGADGGKLCQHTVRLCANCGDTQHVPYSQRRRRRHAATARHRSRDGAAHAAAHEERARLGGRAQAGRLKFQNTRRCAEVAGLGARRRRGCGRGLELAFLCITARKFRAATALSRRL